jgi:hypothetical protein
VLRPAQFATTFNIRNVLTDVAILLVLAVGMTYVVVTAGIDLSVGSVLVFSGVVGAKVMVAAGGAAAGWGGILLGVLASVLAGTGWGVLNGVAGQIPSLVVIAAVIAVVFGLVLARAGEVPLAGEQRRGAVPQARGKGADHRRERDGGPTGPLRRTRRPSDVGRRGGDCGRTRAQPAAHALQSAGISLGIRAARLSVLLPRRKR